MPLYLAWLSELVPSLFLLFELLLFFKMRKLLLFSVTAIATFLLLTDVDASGITGSGCTFKAPWTTVRGYSVFSSGSCSIDSV